MSGWVIGTSAGGGSAAADGAGGGGGGGACSSLRFECQVPNPSAGAVPKKPVVPSGSPSASGVLLFWVAYHYFPGVRELVDSLMWAANLTATTISETIV